MGSALISVSADDLVEEKPPALVTVHADDLLGDEPPQQLSQPQPGQIDLGNSSQTIPRPDISPHRNVLSPEQRRAETEASKYVNLEGPDIVDISPHPTAYPYLSSVLPKIPQGEVRGKLQVQGDEITGYTPYDKPIHKPDIDSAEEFTIAHPQEAAVSDALLNVIAHVGKGATLGTLDVPGGTVGLPFSHKEQVAAPLQYSTPDVMLARGEMPDADKVNAYLEQKEQQQGFEAGSLGRYSQQQITGLISGSSLEPEEAYPPELDEAMQASMVPTGIPLRGTAETGAEMIGSAAPYSKLSSLVDAALLKVPGLAPAIPAIAGAAPVAEETAAALVPYSKEALDAVSLMQRHQAIRRIAGQTITGSIFNAIEPREQGETIPGRMAAGAVVGAGMGVANEALGIGARALKDHRFGQALKKLHKELSDELLARQQMVTREGRVININSREAADQIAQDFLNNQLRPEVQTEDLNKAAQQIREQRASRVQKTEQPKGQPPEAPPAVSAQPQPKEPPPGPPQGTRGLLEQEKVTRGDTVLVPDAEGKAVEAKVDFAAQTNKGNWVRVVMPDGSKAKFDRTQIGKVPETVHADDLAASGEGPAEGVQEPAENIPKNIPQTIHADDLENAKEPKSVDDYDLDQLRQSGTQVNELVDNAEGTTKITEPQIQLSDKFKQGDTVKVGEETGKVIAATKNNVRVKIGAQERMVKPGEVEKVEPEKQGFKYGSTQINIAPESELGKAHTEAVNKIPEEHLGAHGREKAPHVTLRYGLKDTSPETVSKIREAAAQIEPFEVPIGKTRTFPVSEHSEGTNPVVAHLEKTPELMKLREAVEKAGNFKPDNFPEYKPHVTLAYVKPEHAHKYEGRGQLEGHKVPVKEIAVSKPDGSQEIIPLGGSHALQKPGPEKVLQRQPGQSGGPGSERGGVEPVQPGQAAAGTRQAQEETAPQSHEPGGGPGHAAEVKPRWEVRGGGKNGYGVYDNHTGNAIALNLGKASAHIRAGAENDIDSAGKKRQAEESRADFSSHSLDKLHKEADRLRVQVDIHRRHLGPDSGHYHDTEKDKQWHRDTLPVDEERLAEVQKEIENRKPAKGDHVTAATPEGKVEGKVVDVHGNQHGRGVDVLTSEGEIKKVKAEEVQSKEPFQLSPPTEDVGVQQYISSLPEHHQEYARDFYQALKQHGEEGTLDIDPVTYGIPDEEMGDIESVDAHLKKLAPENGQEHTKVEHTGEPEGAPRVQSEGRRQVPHPEGQDRPPLGGTPPQVLPEPHEKRDAGRSSKPSGSGDHPATPRPATAGPESGASEGAGLPELADAGERKPQRSVNPKNQDWFAHPEKFDVSGTPGERLQRNLQALRIVAEVQKSGRGISDEERNALASYTGWGAIPQVFDTRKANYSEESQWKRAQAALKKLLTPEEYDRARNSTQNAHYTSPEIVRFMWQAASRMGFKGGAVLEPSLGTGNFLGMMPKGIRGKVNAIANEMDPSTFYISKLLYPGATIYNQNYVDLILPDNSIDLAIGNVPFGEKVYDPKYPKLNARIHDYFLVKTIDKVRPGGLMMFITSDGTLDKQNTAIRDILADKADLVYAVRFPSSAFEENAGTEVVTDLLVLRKRAPEQVARSESFTHTVPVAENVSGMMGRPEAKGLKINEYYVQHPKNILGSLEIRRGRYGAEPELTVKGDGPIDNRLKTALEDVPRGVMEKANASPITSGEIILAPETAQEGGLLIHEGKVMQRLNGALSPASSVTGKDGKPSPQLIDRAHKLIDLRDSTQELINLMRTMPEGQPVIAQRQKALAGKYDEYVRKHGLLNERRTKDVFADDPQYPLLLSLEDYDRDTKKGEKADIFSKRTIHPPAKLVAVSDDPAEALFQVLSERGFPDVEFMGQLSGKPVEQIAKALEAKNLIFKDPLTGQYETSDKYLSGYVREKLVDAQAAVAQGSKEYERNVEALTEIIPKDIPIKVIDVRLGGTYIPVPAIKEFSQSILNAGRAAKISNTAGTWKVSDFYRSPEVTSEYAGGGVYAEGLLENALNLRQTLVYDIHLNDDGKEIRTVNQQKSVAAQAAQAKIAKKFAAFVREHSRWGPHIERLYNDKYNGIVTPNYDGSHLAFPGMSTLGLRDGKLMPHQVNAIRRVIEEGRGLLAHAVGAGKTFEGIVSAMELKRLGRIRKPMFVVPNHKVGDWAEDYQRRYPGARVLAPSKKDFEAVNRNKVMARIATGDWDGIIIAHSQFDLMDISPERQRITMEREMDELEATIAAVTEANGKRDRSVKQLEKAKDRLKAKLDALKDLKADKTILFDQLGVDHLVIDEIQRYKNLTFYTKMSRVAGLSQGNSKRALRLKMKTDYLLEKYNNRGVVGLTGTPVSNTMAEQRHMTVFVAPDVLHKAGINYFDDWAANFGEIITAMELSADGRSFKPRSKFAKFVNVPEMQLMFRSFSDVKTSEDLSLPVPKLEGGKPMVISVPSTELTEPYIQSIIRRAKAIRGEPVEVMGEDGRPLMTEKKDDKGNVVMRGGKAVMVPQMTSLKRPDPTEDNMLKVTSDGRKIATDARLIDPDLPDHPESKINAVVKSVYEEWKQGQKEKLTQLVFLDMYRFTRIEGGTYDEDTGKREGGRPVEVLNLYHDMRQKWMDKGVPIEEIAIIHDYKSDEQKQKLFDAVNNGRVRILLGSTQKMGEGMNVQKRLKALHHVDAPWKPGELEQRNGRIVRQGNMNDSVRVYNYVTKGSFDAYMLQTLQTKAEFIHQVMSGKFQGRTMVDAASDMVLSLEEMKAIASGNPDVKRKMELEAEIARYEALEREFESSIERNRTRAGMRRQDAAKEHAVIAAMDKVLKDWEKATEGDKFHLKILGKEFNEFEDASKWLKDQDIPVVPFHFEINSVPVRAEYFNMEQRLRHFVAGSAMGFYLPWESQPRSAETMLGMLRSLNAILQPKAMRERIDAAHKRAEEDEQQADKLLELAQTGAFPEAKDLEKARKELKQVSVRLGIDDEEAALEQQVAADVDNAGEEEPQAEDDGGVAYSVPDGWDGIEPEPSGKIAFHYEPAAGAFPPIIDLSKGARKAISTLPGMSPFTAISITRSRALKMAFDIEREVERFGVEPAIANDLAALRQAVLRAADEGQAAGVILMDGDLSSSRYREVLREELFHSAQQAIGGGSFLFHVSDPQGLMEHPAAQKYFESLRGRGYGHVPDHVLIAEMAAKIGAMTDSDLFAVLTPEEAADWLAEYMDRIAQAHGVEALDRFDQPTILHDAVREIFDNIRDWVASNQEERDAEKRQSPRPAGTQEGGGGTQEPGERLPEDSSGPAQESAGGSHQNGPEEAAAIAQPLYSLPPSGGGSAPKPAKFEFPDKDVQEEFDAARGIEKPGTIEAFKEGLTRFSHMAIRTYEHLPRGERYEQLRFELKKLEKAQSMARDRAAQGLRNILEGLTPEQYYNFSVKVILDDLLETAKDGLEVPFFESKAQLERTHQAISEHAKDDSQVQRALEQRGQFWEKLKNDYTSAMDSIGFKLGNRLSRENYYRHQVLQYANLKGSGGAGKKLRTPTGRGHLKTREGSDLPINTDYLQVEHEVMMHFLVDTESAKVIKFVQQSEDVVNQLKRAAMAHNIEGIMDVFRQLEEMELDGPSAEQMYKKLNVKQAMAINRMGELAAFDDLPNGTGKNDFSDLFAELASVYNARKAGLDDAKLSDQAAGQLIRYASWVIRKEPSAAKSAAALLFKGVAEKRAFIKENLGENFQTWRNLVPEGYTIWQPREGHTLYFTQTVPEHLVQGLSEEAGKQLGLTADDLRTVLARGSRFREYVIPTEVAETLDNLRPDIKKTLLAQVAAPLTKAWKIWELSSPRRFLRFRQKHISGQAEAMFVGNPAAFKEIPASASEIWDYYKNGNISPMLQGWLDRGGSGSSLLSQEVGEINKLELFRRLYEAQQSNKIKAYSEHIWQAYWKTARLSIDVAESVLRYAAYRRYLGGMRANGGMPKDWGASRPDEVKALKSPQDRAWKMANDLLGAYDDISALGQELRKYAFPFWSFQEINFKRAIRFIKNAGYESPTDKTRVADRTTAETTNNGSATGQGYGDGLQTGDATGASGGGAGNAPPPGGNYVNASDGYSAFRAGRKIAGQFARKSPFLAYRLGKLLLKMSALWAAVTAYNMLFHRKEWEELSEEDRAKPVLIIGRDQDGHIIKTPRLGAMAEILGWFGLDAPQHEIRAWLNGQKNTREVMEDMAKAPVNKLAGQLNNFLKVPTELATKKSLFPDVFHPHSIHDRGDYLAKELGMEEEVKRLKGEPTPGYGHAWLAAIFDKVDEGQSAYYAIAQAKREYLEKQGKFMDDASFTPKGEALRNMKLAAHYGDEEAYEKFLIEYIEAGGGLKQMRQSLKGMDPLGGMSKADKIQFLASLSEEQQEQLTKAIEYYLTYLYSGERPEEHGEAEPQNEGEQVPPAEQ